MKYCRHCGNELCDDAVICPKCGCSVDYYNNQYNAQTPANTENYTTLSIVGFVFAFVESLVGLIISILAYNEAKKIGNQKSMNFAKIGIIISSVIMGFAVFVVIIWFVIVLIALSAGGLSYM